MKKSLLKKIALALIIVLSGLGVWKFYTSSFSATFWIGLREVLGRTNPILFCLAIILYLFSIPLAVLSWNALLKAFRSGVPVYQLVPILMAGVFTNNITPMSRAGGEIVRVYGIHEKFRLPYSIAFLSVALSKLTELIPLALLGTIGVFALIQERIFAWHQFRYMAVVICFAIGIIVLCIREKRRLRILWQKVLGYLIRREQKHSENYLSVDEITAAIKQKRALSESLLFSLLLWVLATIRLMILAYALGIEMSFTIAAAATVWCILVGLVAFTPGGIGLVEGGLAASLILMGIPSSEAFALAILERSISYFLATAIGFVCFFALGGRQFLAKTKSAMI